MTRFSSFEHILAKTSSHFENRYSLPPTAANNFARTILYFSLTVANSFADASSGGGTGLNAGGNIIMVRVMFGFKIKGLIGRLDICPPVLKSSSSITVSVSLTSVASDILPVLSTDIARLSDTSEESSWYGAVWCFFWPLDGAFGISKLSSSVGMSWSPMLSLLLNILLSSSSSSSSSLSNFVELLSATAHKAENNPSVVFFNSCIFCALVIVFKSFFVSKIVGFGKVRSLTFLYSKFSTQPSFAFLFAIGSNTNKNSPARICFNAASSATSSSFTGPMRPKCL